MSQEFFAKMSRTLGVLEKFVQEKVRAHFSAGEAFLLIVGAFLLTVKLLCLQSLKALIRRTFPL